MRKNDYMTNYYWLAGGFLCGVFAGAAAGLLMAPQAGRRTRRMLRETVEDAAESVADAGQEFREHGRRLAEDTAEFVDRAAHAVSR
jgi:gas vesicle protein